MRRTFLRPRGRWKSVCCFRFAQVVAGIGLVALFTRLLSDSLPVTPTLDSEHYSGRSLSSLTQKSSPGTEFERELIEKFITGDIKIPDPVVQVKETEVVHEEIIVTPTYSISTFSSLNILLLEEKRLRDAARAAVTSIAKTQNIEEYSFLDSKERYGKGLLRRCPFKQEPLERDIKYSSLTHIVAHLNYRGTAYKNPFPEETCVGLPCPYFATCNKAKTVISAVCHNPTLTDPHIFGDPPVKAFPPDGKLASEKEQLVRPTTNSWIISDGGLDDFLNPKPQPGRDRVWGVGFQMEYSGDMMVFENVYLDHKGQIFNDTHHFLMGGCYFLDDFEYKAKVTKVTHFHTLLNLVNWNSANLYHVVTEVLPEFLVSAEVLRLYEGIPAAFRITQDEGMIQMWLDLIHWPLRKVNIHFMEDDNLYFAEKLVVPSHSYCARPSGSVLKNLRTDALGIRASSRKKGNTIVIFGSRPQGISRYIPEEGAILKGLQNLYTEAKVVSFFGNLTIGDTQDLFKKAALYIAAHGAGMTNMIFMDPGSLVLEVRTDNFHNSCYHYLSDRCELFYHAVMGKGDFSSPLEVGAETILTMVKEILPVQKLEQW